MAVFLKRILPVCLLLILISSSFIPLGTAPLRVCSWNIRDFGKTKDDAEIDFIANTIKEFDVVLIQEVVAGYGGAQAVGRLGEALNRKGAKWNYTISDPTFGVSYKRERYAFLWKASKVKKIGNAWLEQTYKAEIDREPYYATFNWNNKEFTLANFHAITKSKQPETEVKYFKMLPAAYPNLKLIFCGDFNLPERHTVFNPLKKMGYLPVLTNQKTTLKKECKAEQCLASEFDNAFYPKNKLAVRSKGVIHFYKSFLSLKEAGRISDHVPFYFEFYLN